MLNGEIALVAGGAKGKGKYISSFLSDYGADVIIIGREEEELKEVHKLNENKITYFVGDITNEDTIKNLVNIITKKYGKLNILVNILDYYQVKNIKDLKISDYDKLFNYDVRAPVNMTIQFLPLIVKCQGQIINIFSSNLSYAAPNISMYSGAVAAFHQISVCWSKELIYDNIKINFLFPGSIDLDNWKDNNLLYESLYPILFKGKDETSKNMVKQSFLFFDKNGNFMTGSSIVTS